jgi:hypothetical protein
MEHLDSFVMHVCDLKKDELLYLNKVICDRIKLLRQQETFNASMKVHVGCRVKLNNTSRKSSHLKGIIGNVEKCNRSKVLVNFNGQLWHIPYTMLEVI